MYALGADPDGIRSIRSGTIISAGRKSSKSPRYISWFRTTSNFVLASPITAANVHCQPPTRLRGRVDLVRVVPGQIPL
jgi:hypothetical protein